VPDLSRPRLPQKRENPRAYTQEEIHRVLHACRTATERAFVIVLAQTAARRGGVCTLRRQNMEDHVASVKEKTGSRILYFHDEAWKAVQFAMIGKDFLSPSDAPMDPKTLEKLMRKLLKRAGVYERGSGEHAFRHAFAAEFEKNGGSQSMRTVIMGHSPGDMSTHYYHVANREAVEAVRKYAPTAFLQCPLDCKLNQEVPV
jgi:integrase